MEGWNDCKAQLFCLLKEDALKDLEDLVKELPWTDPLRVWELNNSLKKKKTKRKKHNLQSTVRKEKLNSDGEEKEADQKDIKKEDCPQDTAGVEPADGQDTEKAPEVASQNEEEEDNNEQSDAKDELQAGAGTETKAGDSRTSDGEVKVLKFRVTCNRAGGKHSFTSNEAARDFGGAVQEHFQWKADMTNFDVEVQCCALEIPAFLL